MGIQPLYYNILTDIGRKVKKKIADSGFSCKKAPSHLCEDAFLQLKKGYINKRGNFCLLLEKLELVADTPNGLDGPLVGYAL